MLQPEDKGKKTQMGYRGSGGVKSTPFLKGKNNPPPPPPQKKKSQKNTYPIRQSLINWPLSSGYFGSWDKF